jgi:hypothetical protein
MFYIFFKYAAICLISLHILKLQRKLIDETAIGYEQYKKI